MLIGVKTSDMKNFERVIEYIVKELQGIKVYDYITSLFTYYKVNKINSEQIKILNYYIEQEIAVLEIIDE
jgi:hypothetical protein